jgi:hypothetical protein
MSRRRFPLPWSVHHNDDSYWVQDATGTRFGYTYFSDSQLTGTGGKMSRDEARRIVTNFANVPALLARKGVS